MISTTEAKAIILDIVQPMHAIVLPLPEVVGLTLAADVYASMDIPAYPQSSMDGFAFSFDEWKGGQRLEIRGEMAAGSNQVIDIRPGEAVRIFTGAPVPKGGDTVVMQEKTMVEKGNLFINDTLLQKGTNVRQQGSEIKTGMLALPKLSRLSPAAIGFLAGIGITELKVFPHPTVTIIVTGNELQAPGQPLKYGRVYESNSFALRTALQLFRIGDINVVQMEDELSSLTSALQQALQRSDLVLLTGGVSVGDYDFVPQAALDCGVLPLFRKVAQRPGKPLYFGKMDNKLVFGLPGNPSSVLTCFYLYVVPALEKLSQKSYGLQAIQAPLGKSYQKAAGLTHYLKGTYDGSTANPLSGQESYRMHSFAQANSLIEIGEGVTSVAEGTSVTVHLLSA